MKKIGSILIICTMFFSLVACSSSENSSQETSGVSETPSSEQNVQGTEETDESSESASAEPSSAVAVPEESEKSALVVYFSATGNTRTVAETLVEQQNADLYEIVPQQPYTDEDLNYNDRSSRSTVEQNDESARPAISGSIDNIDHYDVIYVGYPIWWGDMPRILYTFFDTYDLAGKTIAPFCTSGGSGLSGTTQTIAELEPDAAVLEGLHIGDSSLSDAESSIAEWISSIELP